MSAVTGCAGRCQAVFPLDRRYPVNRLGEAVEHVIVALTAVDAFEFVVVGQFFDVLMAADATHIGVNRRLENFIIDEDG